MKRNLVNRGVRVLAILLLLLIVAPSRAYGKSYPYYTVKVDKGYLALRTAPAYDESNEIGELYTGDVVRVIDSTSNKTYWKVKTSKYKSAGWVNKNYLVYLNTSESRDYRVTVSKGFLALRTEPAYDDSNIIGELYTGDIVTLVERYNNKYWWVYSSKYGTCGYVNKDYLSSAETSAYETWTVKVDKGYLALRTAPAYNDANEIGRLDTGDTVVVKDKSNGTYWWVYSPKYNKSGYVNSNYLVR